MPAVAILMVEVDTAAHGNALDIAIDNAALMHLVGGPVADAKLFSAARFEKLYENGPHGGGLRHIFTRFEFPAAWGPRPRKSRAKQAA